MLEFSYFRDVKLNNNRAEFEKHNDFLSYLEPVFYPECKNREDLLKRITGGKPPCEHVERLENERWGTYLGEHYSENIKQCSVKETDKKVEIYRSTCTLFAYSAIISSIFAYYNNNAHWNDLPEDWALVLVHSFNRYLTNTLLYLQLQQIIVSPSGDAIAQLKSLITRIKDFCGNCGLANITSTDADVILPDGYYRIHSIEKNSLKKVIKYSIDMMMNTNIIFSHLTEGISEIKENETRFFNELDKASEYLDTMDTLFKSGFTTGTEWEQLKQEITDFFTIIPYQMKIPA